MTTPLLLVTHDDIVAAGRVDDDRVHLTVADAVCTQVDVDLADVGIGQIVDRDRIGTAQRVELDRLHVVEIHGDGGDVASEPRPPAIVRDVDFLIDVGAVEQERVDARLPIDRVAAIARIPDERVVASAERGRIVAAPADDEIVPGTADDAVIAVTSIERDIDRTSAEPGRVDPVVASEPVDDEQVATLRAADRQLRGEPVDADRRAGSDHD